MFAHNALQAFPSHYTHGRNPGPRRGVEHGPGAHNRQTRQHSGAPPFPRNALPPTNVPPPPPPPQAYPNRVPVHSTFPTIPPPLSNFPPRPSILPVHSPVYTVAPALNNSSSTSVWSEFKSPAGVKYYYNSVTKESTYEKPPGFVSPQPSSTSQQPGAVNSLKWREYIAGATGKKYYSDGVTTTWEKPAAFAAPALSLSTADSVAEKTSDTGNTINGESPRKKLKTSNKPKCDFGSKDEAIAAFKGFLIAKDVSPTLKWSELTKLYSSDSRWIMCEDALTTGERKQALAEYQTKRTNELRLLERQEKVRAREAFMELLTDSLPKLKSLGAWKTSFKDIRDSLARDDRFHVVADESTRESLFLDFCEEVKKREDRKKRDQRREARENFLVFLSEKQESGSLRFASNWNSFVATLNESDKNDERFIESTHMSNSDREIYFADFLLDLQVDEDDKRRRIREAKQRAEQDQRDAFEMFLVRLARDEGKIFPWSGWRDAADEITVDSSYGPLYEHDPDAPRQVFDEFVSEWNGRYRRDRELLGKLMRPTSQTKFVVDCDTPYETFTNAILETAQSFPGVLDETITVIDHAEPVSSAKIYFKELQSRSGTARPVPRRAGALRRGYCDSSEDEGEINEDPEIQENEEKH